MRTLSPLRYPGGKGRLAPLLECVFKKLPHVRHFAEAYAGGAGMGLHFLFNGYVRKLVLNDLDYRIFAFWNSVLSSGEKFAEKIRAVPLDMEEWRKQRNISLNIKNHDEFELGFSSFYLNRTNYGGVIGGGPIGGLMQNGKYKIDARFNRERLARLVLSISGSMENISSFNLNAVEFISRNIWPDTLVYLDPPYLDKKHLYRMFPDAIEELSEKLRSVCFPWIMTINDSKETRALFSWTRTVSFQMPYSFLNESSRRKGNELLVWGNIGDDIFDFRQKIFLEQERWETLF